MDSLKTNDIELIKEVNIEIDNTSSISLENKNSGIEITEEKRFLKIFKKTFINFLEYSTIGGLTELAKRKDFFSRIFWVIIVLVCFSYTTVTFVEKLRLFFKYSVILSHYKYQEIPTAFPAITICNQNPFNEQHAFKYLQEKLSLYNDYGYYNQKVRDNGAYLEYYFDYQVILYNLVPPANQLKRIILNDDNFNETEMSSLGYNLDRDMLISCSYNGKNCSEVNGDFKKFWNNVYGNCYTFNRKNYTFLTGNQNGLHLEMVVGKSI